MVNAFADGSQITICDEMLGLEDLTDDMLLLVLLHEEGHNFYRHTAKIANLVKTLNDLKPNQKTSKLMVELVTALRQQHEFEADEYSYNKSSKLRLSEESCEALSKFSEPSDVQEDDSDSTHPSSWKRIHRCKDVLGG
jgi:Zn-dependent protease with chaperone function